MLANLLFCLNATVPIFLLMVLGYVFKKINIFNDGLTKGLNNFVFKVALPVLVYKELATSDVEELWDAKFVLFCLLATVLSIIIAYTLSFLFKEKEIRPEFVQGTYRSSAALLGVGIATNLYGNAGMTPLMIIGAVPLYNVFAVIVLTLGQGEGKLTGALMRKTLWGVITNPIIIGVMLGIVRAFIPVPILLPKTLNYVSCLATPLGLMALGASFHFKEAITKLWPTGLATFLKLIGLGMIIIPIAVSMGYTHDRLIAVLIMTSSPTTVSTFVMAKSMGYNGTVSAGIVMLTTILSAFTLTVWLYILRTYGLI
ncbi:AEC family transporter [Pseudobutyrivibrio sp.]|uniref:AEC family transporter n=1 Tax=Pseudobutyrivibrio sp. TaxID=2014367 RepID=UPI001B6BC639|nr:AEC family transporter [Pseudobutyrivibrio sp.]MBP3260986.1 AEC family transporter [Pseudobutyrivibrio sp.]